MRTLGASYRKKIPSYRWSYDRSYIKSIDNSTHFFWSDEEVDRVIVGVFGRVMVKSSFQFYRMIFFPTKSWSRQKIRKHGIFFVWDPERWQCDFRIRGCWYSFILFKFPNSSCNWQPAGETLQTNTDSSASRKTVNSIAHPLLCLESISRSALCPEHHHKESVVILHNSFERCRQSWELAR